MRQRPQAAPAPAASLSPRRLGALAEEAAVHVDTGLAMAGLDEAFEASVEPTPAGLAPRFPGMRIVPRCGEGEGLCAYVEVLATGTCRVRVEGDARGRTAPGPDRSWRDLHELAGDLSRALREAVTGFRPS